MRLHAVHESDSTPLNFWEVEYVYCGQTNVGKSGSENRSLANTCSARLLNFFWLHFTLCSFLMKQYLIHTYSMNGENWPLGTDELVEFEI